MENQSDLGTLIIFILAIGFMLGGLDILTKSNPHLNKAYRWLLRRLVLNPLQRGLRWGGRQLWLLTLYLGRQFRRGVYYIWIRLTT